MPPKNPKIALRKIPITAKARVKEKLEDKRWVRMELIWTNQRGDAVALGEAVVIPPPGK